MKDNKFEKGYSKNTSVEFDFIIQSLNNRVLNRRVYKKVISKTQRNNEIHCFINKIDREK